MKVIELTKGYQTTVDDADYDRLIEFRWFATERSSNVYAARDPSRAIGGSRIYMHRWILNAPATLQIDHVNGDGLDNRRENLRLATPKQNSENRTGPTRSATGYRGVRKVGPGSFHAYVNTENRQIGIGCWGTSEEAATARDLEVIRIGSRARLNFETPPFSAEILETTRHDRPKPKSGHPGIRFKAGAWETWVRRDGKRIYLGRFPTIEAALVAQKMPESSDLTADLDNLFGGA